MLSITTKRPQRSGSITARSSSGSSMIIISPIPLPDRTVPLLTQVFNPSGLRTHPNHTLTRCRRSTPGPTSPRIIPTAIFPPPQPAIKPGWPLTESPGSSAHRSTGDRLHHTQSHSGTMKSSRACKPSQVQLGESTPSRHRADGIRRQVRVQ
jgi:hypothetical protein